VSLGWLKVQEEVTIVLTVQLGEMWNLEDLSEECARQGRYSFFLTSMPLNIPGGVAGPANVLAIF